MKCAFSKYYINPDRNHKSEFPPYPSSVKFVLTSVVDPPYSLLVTPIFVRWGYTHASSHDAHRPHDTLLPRFQPYHINQHPILVMTSCSNRILPAIPPSPFHHVQQLLYQNQSLKYPYRPESDPSLGVRRRVSSQLSTIHSAQSTARHI